MDQEEYNKFFNPPYSYVSPKQQKINKLKHIYPEKDLRKLKSKQLGAIIASKISAGGIASGKVKTDPSLIKI